MLFRSVNGAALRGRGANVGHAGGSQDKAERFRARFGDCFPPGQCKDRSSRGSDENGGDADESEAPEAPEGSEAPVGSQAP